MIASAAALGVLAGAATGYGIQWQRPPTPLPPLAGEALKYPKKPAASTKPLSADEDHLVVTDGDLRKLLLPKPGGAEVDERTGERVWKSAAEYADGFRSPAWMFTEVLDKNLRRVAHSAWTEKGDGMWVNIDLVQFRETDNGMSARMHFGAQKRYMPQEEHAGNVGTALPGTFDGRVFFRDAPVIEPGYLPRYEARALARRGDIVMDIVFNGTKPIDRKAAMDIAARQLERL
ncbi:hypothetical protein GQS52_11045 [Streptomyces sp. SCUT-3]|nr:hypothetical protein C0036_24710 [Streptomyces sp. DJ]QMV25013.1 hypothetical protein GQS52_11045 [Streptomyces sp. SCUT-3]